MQRAVRLEAAQRTQVTPYVPYGQYVLRCVFITQYAGSETAVVAEA